MASPPHGSSQEGRLSSVRLHVKVSAGVHPSGSLWEKEGLVSVVPLFPDDPDEELSCFYLVEVTPTAAEHVTEQLIQDPSVEFVEAPPRRSVRGKRSDPPAS